MPSLLHLPLELVSCVFHFSDIRSCVRLSMTCALLQRAYCRDLPCLFIPRMKRLGIDVQRCGALASYASCRALTDKDVLCKLPKGMQHSINALCLDVRAHTQPLRLDAAYSFVVAYLSLDLSVDNANIRKVLMKSYADVVKGLCAVRITDAWLVHSQFVRVHYMMERFASGCTFGINTTRLIVDAFGIVGRAMFSQVLSRFVLSSAHVRAYLSQLGAQDVDLFCKDLVNVLAHSFNKPTVVTNYKTTRDVLSSQHPDIADALMDAEIQHTKSVLSVRNPYTSRNVRYAGHAFSRIEQRLAFEKRETREAFQAYVMRSLVTLNERLFWQTIV